MNPIKSAIIQNSRYGVKDRCLEFSSAENMIKYPISTFNDIINGSDGCTVELWINPNSVTDGRGIFQLYCEGSRAFILSTTVVSSGKLYFNTMGRSISTDSANLVSILVQELMINNWYHIVHVYDYKNTDRKVYINGAAIFNDTPVWGSTTYVRGTDAVRFDRIGNLNDETSSFLGQIDEFRIWNHARTEAQIKRYMNTRLYGTETGLVAYYPMDEGTGSTAFDKSTNSNDGTITGASWIKP
jgi:hypothetical protein